MLRSPGSPRLALHWQILIGLVAGILVGIVLNAYGAAIWAAAGVNEPAAYLGSEVAPADPEANAGAGVLAAVYRFLVNLNALVGDLFLRCLRFIAVPIILFSLIVAVGGIADLRRLGRLGVRTLLLFTATTIIAVAIGLVIANTFTPGNAIPAETRDAIAATQAAAAETRIASGRTASAWGLIRSIVPTNPFDALARGDMIQVVFFALALGFGLSLVNSEGTTAAVRVFQALTDAIIALVRLLMRAAPFAVFALIAPIVAALGLGVLQAMLAYCLCVVGGLAVMLLAVYPGILRLLTPVGYREFFRGLAPAQLLAFTSSSSAATLPVTLQCVRDRLRVPHDITSFVASLGTTVNMDGTALMQSVAAVFVAQLYGHDLTIGQQMIIVLTATLAAIGSPGIPSGGIVMLVVVLESVGLPLEGIAVILAVDRLLDMCRTVINVTGDALACVVVAHMEGELPRPEGAGAAVPPQRGGGV